MSFFWNDTREQSFDKSSRHQADVVRGIGFGDVDLPCSLLATRRSVFLAAESDPSRVVNPFRRFPGGQAWDLPRGRSKSRVMGDIDKSLVDPMSVFFLNICFSECRAMMSFNINWRILVGRICFQESMFQTTAQQVSDSCIFQQKLGEQSLFWSHLCCYTKLVVNRQDIDGRRS